MKKEDALKIILNCARLYHENLENKNIMYILEDKNKKITYMETVFLPSNYLHLTGINISNKKIKSSTDFYNLCLKNHIKISDFSFNSNGTTPLKLEILSQIVHIQKVAKIVGDYSETKLYLSTNKIIGNVKICLGFIKVGKYYIPNTALQEDIRNITKNQLRVIAIYEKDRKDKQYKNRTYLNKNISIENIINKAELDKKIDCTKI